MKLTIPKLEITKTEGFTPEKDIFLRKDFGERLALLIEQAEGDLVIALDAKWGEGKSTFIKMWQGHIEHQRSTKIKSIYFDSFANDYQKDPFLALISEMYVLLADKSDQQRKDFKEKVGNVAKSMFRGALKIGARSFSAGILDGSIVDNAEKDISSLIAEQVDGIISDKLENVTQDKLAMTEFKSYLQKLVEKSEHPIVFIIDELDRCRPDFALELVEQIKHLFSVPGITFLLVLNREQLEKSVESRYGSGIQSTLYLQKFVNLWINLPRKYNKENFHDQDHGVKYIRYAISAMLNENETFNNPDAVDLLCELTKYFTPSFREIEQVLSNFSLIQNMANNDKYYSHYQVIFSLVCFIKVSKPKLFESLRHNDIEADQLITEAGLENIPNNDYIDYLTNYIKFDLGDEDVKSAMLENNEITSKGYGRSQNNILQTVCSWLSEMKIS